jgi:hypothetical protein
VTEKCTQYDSYITLNQAKLTHYKNQHFKYKTPQLLINKKTVFTLPIRLNMTTFIQNAASASLLLPP